MSRIITEWEPRRVIAAISGQVVQNMDRAAAFAAQQARARAPSGPRQVRKGVKTSGSLRRNVLHEVHAEKDYVEGIVGVRRGIYWAWFVERGTRKMRARPFLRPAVFENAATILRIIQGAD